MGTNGIHATRSAVSELEAVGAMRIEKLRGEAGRLAGQRWVVVTPSRWAIETPLQGKTEKEKGTSGTASPEFDFPSVGFSDSRRSRLSEKDRLRFSKDKDSQTQGSPTTTRARMVGDVVVVEEVEDEDTKQLAWPAGLSEEQIGSMRRTMFGNWPGLTEAQELLDELAGQLQLGKVKNPPGLLRRLLQRQQEGSFTHDLGPEVRQAREARKKQAEREAGIMAGGNGKRTGEPDLCSAQSQVAIAARKQLLNLRNKMVGAPSAKQPQPSGAGHRFERRTS
jgi:hypothetical protein